MFSNKRKFGDLGEKMACKFLKRKKYLILETNYQKRIGEIDIIAKFDGMIHFIEVKTRTCFSSKKFGLPQESVNFIISKKSLSKQLFFICQRTITPIRPIGKLMLLRL